MRLVTTLNSPLPRNSKRRGPIARAPRYPAKLGTLDIQRVLPKTGRGPQLVLVWGWPTPIRMNARTELPPLPRKPVYGPAAREEVLRLKRVAKREKINLGPFTQINLGRVARKERPLGYSLWKATTWTADDGSETCLSGRSKFGWALTVCRSSGGGGILMQPYKRLSSISWRAERNT